MRNKAFDMSVKEKELLLQQKLSEDELETKSNHHTPEGLFTKPTQDIVDGLLKDAHGDEELALRRITFYINRAGDGLSNKTAVNAAKRELEKKVEAKKEAEKNKLHNMLSEYFKEAYSAMFEKDDDNTPIALSDREAIKFLLDNDINVAWMLASPHPEVIDSDRNEALGLFGAYDNGMLKMLPHADQLETNKSKWDSKNPVQMSPEKFKNLIGDEVNNSTHKSWNKYIEDHYHSVDEEKDMFKTGDELYKAWIERFYRENKDDLDLKSVNDPKTYREFRKFWTELPDYEKRRYAIGVNDKWDLATLDVNGSMPIIRIRMKKSPTRRNSKSVKRNYLDFIPQLATEEEAQAWEDYNILQTMASNSGKSERTDPGFYNAIKSIIYDNVDQRFNPSKDRIEYWKNEFADADSKRFAIEMYPDLTTNDIDEIKKKVFNKMLNKIINSSKTGKEDLETAEEKAREFLARGAGLNSTHDELIYRFLDDKYKTPEVKQSINDAYKKAIEKATNARKAEQEEAATAKKAEIIADTPGLDRCAKLMADGEELYKSQVKETQHLKPNEEPTDEDYDAFERLMSYNAFGNDPRREKYLAKCDRVDCVDPIVLERRVNEFKKDYPDFLEKLNKWREEKDGVMVRTVITCTDPWMIGDEVAKKVVDDDGDEYWQIVTDTKEKDELLKKYRAPAPALTSVSSDEQQLHAKNEKEKIRHFFDLYRNGKYAQFADKPINDGHGTDWVVTGVDDTNPNKQWFFIHKNNDPTNYWDRKVDGSELVSWLDKYNGALEDDEDDASDENQVDAKSLENLKNHFNGDDNNEEDK